MTVFSIFLLLAMLIVGGMAVDMMRHETYRTQLQATLDRCALAAADLDQTVDPEAVVRDCFQKAGFARQLQEVQVRRSATTSAVQVTAAVTLPTIFMRMAGVATLSAPASAAAEEAVSNIEVSLVLDISGSMRFNNRLTNLKPAARDFVTQVLHQSNDVAASINLVPYAGATNPGVTMFDYLAGVRYSQRGRPNAFTNVSSCLEIPGNAFGRTGLPQRGLAQTPHFMMWAIDSSVMDWGWCPEDDTSIIYASDDEGALHRAIDGIRMHDGTGTHFAMKWGVALLDPTTRTAFNHLADRGEVPRQFRDRPRAWADRDTQKFVVLMTDGQITEQVRPVNPAATANTSRELERRPSTERRNLTTAAQNVVSFYASCDAAKANGVIVYTIAFEAPAPGPAEIARCASSPSHFFDANGKEEIADAFRSIANQINALRLTR